MGILFDLHKWIFQLGLTEFDSSTKSHDVGWLGFNGAFNTIHVISRI